MLVGLDEAALLALATAPAGSVRKASRPSLAAALGRRRLGRDHGLGHDDRGPRRRDPVFATGGIGGVHRGVRSVRPAARHPTFDISSDLEELGRTPVAVVCAGPKAILDVPATLEYLETRGVPVIAIGQAEVPGFYARSSGIAAPASVPDIAAAARLVATHLALGLGGGILVCVPVPEAGCAPGRCGARRRGAGRRRRGLGRHRRAGPLTPWLLARIAVLTDGASIRANTALIVNDARVAGELAVRLAGM